MRIALTYRRSLDFITGATGGDLSTCLRVGPSCIEGHLVSYLRRLPGGKVDFAPLYDREPGETAEQARARILRLAFQPGRPVILILDRTIEERRHTAPQRVWHSSNLREQGSPDKPVYFPGVELAPDGWPVLIRTRSSEYLIQWLDPVPR